MIGISSTSYQWADLHEAFSRCVDEFGLDLIEFSTARLRESEYPELGLLSQKWGVSLGLRSEPALAPVAAAGWAPVLKALGERCEEALASYVVLDLDALPRPEKEPEQLAEALATALPDFEARGVRVCLAIAGFSRPPTPDPPWELPALLSRFPSDALRFCLDVSQMGAAGLLSALGPRLGCVRLSRDPGTGAAKPGALLRTVAATGFRGPVVLAFPEEGAPHRFREVAGWLRAITTTSRER